MFFKHPCDDCLVQACCVKSCDKYSSFIRKANILPFLILIISFLINIFMINSIIKLSLSWYIVVFIFLFIWVDSFIGCYLIFKQNDEKMSLGMYLFSGSISSIVFIGLIFELIFHKFYSTSINHEKRLKIKSK